MVVDQSWVPLIAVIGLSLVLLSGLMLGLCYWFRRKRNARRQLRQEVIQRYRPKLFDWLAGQTVSLSQPQTSMEWIHLISLWNDLYSKVGSSEHKNLREAAEELDLADRAVQLLDSRKTRQMIIGVITLGHLEDNRRLDRIKELTGSSITLLKMQSIRALAILQPREALQIIFDDLIEHPNQSPKYYLGFCRSIDIEALMEETLDRLQKVTPDQRDRLIPFLELAQNQPAREYLRKQLQQADQPEILSASLKVLRKIGQPNDQSLVREFLDHSTDFVRVQAARTLGAIGTPRVTEPLVEALSDSNWWVRYRAAESLVKLPATSIGELKSILSGLDDPVAKKAFQSALSEVDV